MPLLPPDSPVPTGLQMPRFTLRMLSIHDLVKDFDAVMSSREQLWVRFAAPWGWPRADLSLEQDLIDLAWHQKEFQRRTSFAYAAMSPDGARVLGCVYIEPPVVRDETAGDEAADAVEAEVWFWARSSELASGLEDELGRAVADWLARDWPFRRVLWQGVAREVVRTVPPAVSPASAESAL
jgi:hypothetical protein